MEGRVVSFGERTRGARDARWGSTGGGERRRSRTSSGARPASSSGSSPTAGSPGCSWRPLVHLVVDAPRSGSVVSPLDCTYYQTKWSYGPPNGLSVSLENAKWFVAEKARHAARSRQIVHRTEHRP
jgi:hypothetical protein